KRPANPHTRELSCLLLLKRVHASGAGVRAFLLLPAPLFPSKGEGTRRFQNKKGKTHMNNKKKNEEPTPNSAPLYKNRVELVGYLGHQPELVNGHAVLSLATKTSWKDKGSDEWQSRTEWHRVIAWGPLVNAVKGFATGEYVLVEGELKSSEYEREV